MHLSSNVEIRAFLNRVRYGEAGLSAEIGMNKSNILIQGLISHFYSRPCAGILLYFGLFSKLIYSRCRNKSGNYFPVSFGSFHMLTLLRNNYKIIIDERY